MYEDECFASTSDVFVMNFRKRVVKKVRVQGVEWKLLKTSRTRTGREAVASTPTRYTTSEVTCPVSARSCQVIVVISS